MSVDGRDALWFEDSHQVAVLDEQGREVVESRRRVGSTLVWMVGDTTLRLEGELTLGQAVAIAESARRLRVTGNPRVVGGVSPVSPRTGAVMSRRTTFGALVVALLLVASAPAAAKGPTRVEIQDLRTGTTTVLNDSHHELFDLMELVGWPEGRSEPSGLDSGTLEHVATLSWTFDDKTPLWIDRIYADGSGDTWVQRRDFHGGGGAVTWGQVRDGDDLAGCSVPSRIPTSRRPPRCRPRSRRPRAWTAGPWLPPRDGGLPLWGVGLLALPVVGLVLAIGWRLQRSVAAERKSRVSIPASS